MVRMNIKVVREPPKEGGNRPGLLTGKKPLTRVLACKRELNMFLENLYKTDMQKATNEDEREQVMLRFLEKLIVLVDKGEGDRLGIIPMFESSALESSSPDVVVNIIKILKYLHSVSVTGVYRGLDKEEIEAVVRNIISQRKDVPGIEAYGFPTTSQSGNL